jgi:hypothetical protein
MRALLVVLALGLFSVSEVLAQEQAPHKRNPLAPSLPQLSDEEENRLDETINRFIDYDSGKLRDGDGKQIVKDFQGLGPESTFALIRGLNRAAKIEHSCPAVTIARKLARILRSSRDLQLLLFARENIGAGITQSSHMGVIRDLRLLCMVRARAVEQAGDGVPRTDDEPSEPGSSSLRTEAPRRKKVRDMSVAELAEAAGKERGLRLRMVLAELGKHEGDQAIDALGSAAAAYDGDMRELAREMLARPLSALGRSELKKRLKDDRAEIRAAAARVAGENSIHVEAELIDLLEDQETEVRRDAHQALVKLSKGVDFGPKSSASEDKRKQAAGEWRTWLKQQSDR